MLRSAASSQGCAQTRHFLVRCEKARHFSTVLPIDAPSVASACTSSRPFFASSTSFSKSKPSRLKRGSASASALG